MTANHPAGYVAPPRVEQPGPGRAAPARAAARFPADAPATDRVVYGPDIVDERDLRLLGQLEGKRILELGTGNGSNAVVLARAGAKVISVDTDATNLARARALADEHEVKVELHEGDLGDVPFVRADAVDLVLSVYALAGVESIDRVFRQAHRVLRPECSLVFSVPHPAWALIDPASPDPLRIAHSWFDREPRTWHAGDRSGTEHPRGFAELVGGLHRANFRVETVIEPGPTAGLRTAWWSEAMRNVPATLILRARKQGI
jgi:SAM-dependent methyltransferase